MLCALPMSATEDKRWVPPPPGQAHQPVEVYLHLCSSSSIRQGRQAVF